MRATALLFAAFLMSMPALACAAEQQPATPDARYPVPVSPNDSVRQKTEMRSNLVALRTTLAKLADKDYVGVEAALKGLVHTGPVAERPGVNTEAFRKLEKEFEEHVDKTVLAARSNNTETVLRELSVTMGFCQSCHMSFRQAVSASMEAPPHKAQ